MGNKLTLQQAYAISTGTFISPTDRKRFTTNLVSGIYKSKLEALMKTTPINLTEIPSVGGTLVNPSNQESGYDFPSSSELGATLVLSNGVVTPPSTVGGVATKLLRIDASGLLVYNNINPIFKENESKIVSQETLYYTAWPSGSLENAATFRLLPPLTIHRCRVATIASTIRICFALSTTISDPLPAPYNITSIAITNPEVFWNMPTNCEIEVYNFVADSGNPGVNFNTTTPFLVFTSGRYLETTEAEAWSNTYEYRFGEYASYSGTIYRAKSNTVPVNTLPTNTTHWDDTGETTGSPVDKYTQPSTGAVTISGTSYYEVRIAKDNIIPFLLGPNGKYSSTPNPSYQANWFNLSTTSPPTVLDDTDPNPPTWDAGMFRVGPVKGAFKNGPGCYIILSNFLATDDQLTSIGSSRGAVTGASWGLVQLNARSIKVGSSFSTSSSSVVDMTELFYHLTGQTIINKLKK